MLAFAGGIIARYTEKVHGYFVVVEIVSQVQMFLIQWRYHSPNSSSNRLPL
jgi:hypothetical protein